MKDITFLHADCLTVLGTLDPKSIALVLTDPPYGHGADLRQSKPTTILNNDSPAVGQAVLDWAAKHNLPTIAFASPQLPWKGEWQQHLVWDKGPGVGMGDLKRTLKPCWELVQVARTGRLRGRRDSAVLSYHVASRDMKVHPTAKPVALLHYLIEQWTNPGDLVFDPFAGIASTGVACVESGRRFLGVELDEKYYLSGQDRLVAAVADRGRTERVLMPDGIIAERQVRPAT